MTTGENVQQQQCGGNRGKSERTRDKIREGLRNRRIGSGRSLSLVVPIAKDSLVTSADDMGEIPLVSAEETMASLDEDNTVVLEVGPDGDTWRYRVERERLAKRSEWFRALLLGPLAPPPSSPPPTIRLEHVEKRAFDHFLRYLHDEPVDFQSVTTARATLDVAHQYLSTQLARLSVKYLEANLNSSNVLKVLKGLSLYAGHSGISISNNLETPSAPPAPGDEAGEIAVGCAGLLSACLTLIDSDPVTILRQERFEELSRREVGDLASRDSLALERETALFEALDRWSASECRRHGVEPTPCNKRSALVDEVWFSVRYLLMTDREFIEGPMASGILTSKESATIVSKILGHNHRDNTTNEERDSSQDRPTIGLSSRPRASRISATDGKSKKFKNGKKEQRDNQRNRRKECASQGQRACASLGDCLVRVLACVFD